MADKSMDDLRLLREGAIEFWEANENRPPDDFSRDQLLVKKMAVVYQLIMEIDCTFCPRGLLKPKVLLRSSQLTIIIDAAKLRDLNLEHYFGL